MSVPQPIAARVADFLAGMSYPHALPPEAGAYARGADFPRLGLKQAVDVPPWPGKANEYTPSGNLRDPSNAASATLFYTGLALGHDLVRAFLLGLLCKLPSTKEARALLYRTACRLADGALPEIESAISSLQSSVSSLQTQINNLTTIINPPATWPFTAILDGPGHAGDVLRWLGNGHCEVATGPNIADQDSVFGLLGADAAAGETINYYPSGTRTPPVPDLSYGRVFRHSDGRAVNEPDLNPDDWSMVVGTSDANGRIDVTIDAQDFLVPNAP